jgi:hypothetical protein
MCDSNKADEIAKKKPDALCDGGTSICSSDGKVVYKLEVSSPGIEYAKRISHGAAVTVNNDRDCAKEYPAAAPGGHRELEPVFDLDNLEATAAEDDLLQVSVKLTPAGPGNVKLAIGSGAANIRIWPSKTKGALADQITLPMEVPAAALPKDLFVEGLSTGTATLEAKYTSPGGLTCSDSLQINVVDLVEKQGGTRKIIYDYNSLIDFEVVGGPANYEYAWDLDGDGSFNSKPFETGNNNKSTATCKYGPAESADTVLLTENAANKRKIYPVAVKLTGGLVLNVKGVSRFGGAVTKGIRVALATFQGDALPGQNTAGLHTLFHWNNTTPVRFNATNKAHRGKNRISYNAGIAANAVTPRSGMGNARVVTFVEIGPGIWTSGQKKEDLIATVNHEIKHLQQHVAVRDNLPANNVWRLLDNHYGNLDAYSDFRECEGHFSEVLNSDIGWIHLLSPAQSDLSLFFNRYNACLVLFAAIPVTPATAAVRAALLALLQDWYKNIPFDEMKNSGYDFSLRAPI